MADSWTSSGGPFDLSSRLEAPSALARLPVGRHGLPREFVEENQRNRLMAAALAVFVKHGYTAASVADIIKAAGVSRHTFYEHYEGKEECFLATYDLTVGWLIDQAILSSRTAGSWPLRVIAVIAKVTDLLADDPRLARIAAVEVLRAGRSARLRHEALVDRLATALRPGRDLDGRVADLPAVLEPLLVGGAVAAVARHIDSGRAGSLVGLGTELSEAILAFYLGPEAARDLLGATERPTGRRPPGPEAPLTDCSDDRRGSE